MMAKRDIPTQSEKHHAYDLRYKLRAVVAAKNSIITAAVQEFEVDITINPSFEYKHPSRLNSPSTDVARR